MVLLAGCATFVISLLVVSIIERRAAAFGLVDLPNSRSSHVAPRPRGGGLGVLCGVAAGVAVTVGYGTFPDARVWTVLAAATLVAGAGLWDDISALAPGPKLAAQLVAAAIVVSALGGFTRVPLPAPLNPLLGWFGLPLAVIWIVGVTNFFNFMDGADGLAGGQACLTFGVIAWALWPSAAAIVAALAAVAFVGFLLRNWAPAHIFLGDVGSGWAGFMLATLPFAAPVDRREDLVLLAATSLALFLIDPLLTLVRRFARGARLAAAHREHAYQQLFDPKRSHAGAVAGLLVAASAVTVAAAAAYQGPSYAWWSLAAAGAVSLVEWRVASSRRRDAH